MRFADGRIWAEVGVTARAYRYAGQGYSQGQAWA